MGGTGVKTRRSAIVTAALLIAMAAVYLNWAIQWWRIANNGGDGYGSGDWLLSYDGGIVRRGLFGTIILTITPESIWIVAVIALMQLLIMGLLFVLLFALFLRTDRSLAWVMVLMSPAVVLFSTIALRDPIAGPRKEIIAFVALAIVAMGYGKRTWYRWAWAGFPIFLLATWSHEALALLTPAFVYLIWKSSGRQANQVMRNVLIAAYSLTAAAALMIAVFFPGTSEIQQGICDAWAERGLITECSEQATGALTLTSAEALEWFRTQLFPHYWEYLPVIALASIPLFVVRFLPRQWRITLVVLIFLAPLFVIAWDYGRWIYLAAMTLSILALALGSRPDAPESMRVPLIAVLAFCLLWGFTGYTYATPVLVDGVLVEWLKTTFPTAWF